jgi:hypothetical protein
LLSAMMTPFKTHRTAVEVSPKLRLPACGVNAPRPNPSLTSDLHLASLLPSAVSCPFLVPHSRPLLSFPLGRIRHMRIRHIWN